MVVPPMELPNVTTVTTLEAMVAARPAKSNQDGDAQPTKPSATAFATV